MEQKKTQKQPKIPRNPEQKQLYVMHIQDENKVSNILKLCLLRGNPEALIDWMLDSANLVLITMMET
jgi:hypothetical protein